MQHEVKINELHLIKLENIKLTGQLLASHEELLKIKKQNLLAETERQYSEIVGWARKMGNLPTDKVVEKISIDDKNGVVVFILKDSA